MKVVVINSADYGSTGAIMFAIAEEIRNLGHECYTFSRMLSETFPKKGHTFFGTCKDQNLNQRLSVNLGIEGIFSYRETKKLLKKIDEIKPDIIFLNALHGWFINLPILFRYIKKNTIKTYWTFHDCWAFTGHCSHFYFVGCDRWKESCGKCPQLDSYPRIKRDATKFMLKQKKKWFTSIKDLTIITPSNWLKEMVEQSFFSKYPIKTIYNGIDLSRFKPTTSDFKEKNNLQEKFIVLGVAFAWGERKGLDDMLELSKRLPNNYKMVLVGLSRKDFPNLPDNIMVIEKVYDPKDLAAIYTAADVFVNCTKEEVLGLVNLEANACGTPVITYDTGGSPECIDSSSGVVVEKNDIDTLEKEVVRVCEQKPFSEEDCIKRAKLFDKNDKYKEYVNLFFNK